MRIYLPGRRRKNGSRENKLPLDLLRFRRRMLMPFWWGGGKKGRVERSAVFCQKLCHFFFSGGTAPESLLCPTPLSSNVRAERVPFIFVCTFFSPPSLPPVSPLRKVPALNQHLQRPVERRQEEGSGGEPLKSAISRLSETKRNRMRLQIHPLLLRCISESLKPLQRQGDSLFLSQFFFFVSLVIRNRERYDTTKRSLPLVLLSALAGPANLFPPEHLSFSGKQEVVVEKERKGWKGRTASGGLFYMGKGKLRLMAM